MRKIKIIEHISMDGIIEHAEGYIYGAWTLPYRTPEGMAMVMEAQGTDFDLLIGRRTYDNWAAFWPSAPGPIAPNMNSATKYVVTHRNEDLTWGPVKNIGVDVVKAILELKQTEGPDLVVSGSSTLTTVLLEAGLADEVTLIIYPVLLGKGKRLFDDTAHAQELEFINSKSTPTGVLLNTYKYVGKMKTDLK